jgi:hypothetical protein
MPADDALMHLPDLNCPQEAFENDLGPSFVLSDPTGGPEIADFQFDGVSADHTWQLSFDRTRAASEEQEWPTIGH